MPGEYQEALEKFHGILQTLKDNKATLQPKLTLASADPSRRKLKT